MRSDLVVKLVKVVVTGARKSAIVTAKGFTSKCRSYLKNVHPESMRTHIIQKFAVDICLHRFTLPIHLNSINTLRCATPITPCHAFIASLVAMLVLLPSVGSAKDPDATAMCNQWNSLGFWQHLDDRSLVLCSNNWSGSIELESSRNTPLHFAAARARAGVVLKILDTTKWKPDLLDIMDHTPLHWAALLGNEASMRELLLAGANPNAKNMTGFTALHFAADRESVLFRSMLHSVGANFDQIDYIDCPTLQNNIKQCNNAEIIKILIRAGSDPNARTKHGKTPLFSASEYGESNIGAITTLLTNGSNPNARTIFGESPLHMLAMRGNGKLINLLIDAGARVNVRDIFGTTPLHQASRYGSEQGHLRVRALLLAGANPNIHDAEGNTPLHHAASSNYSSPEIIKELLAAGANANKRNENRKCPANLAENNVVIRQSEVFWEIHDACSR